MASWRGVKVKHQETFPDGSRLVELENGTLLILEGLPCHSPLVTLADRTVTYDEPAPPPGNNAPADVRLPPPEPIS